MFKYVKIVAAIGVIIALAGCGSTPKVKQLSNNTFSIYANDFAFPAGSAGCNEAKERFSKSALAQCPNGFDIVNQNVNAPPNSLCEVVGDIKCKTASSEIK